MRKCFFFAGWEDSAILQDYPSGVYAPYWVLREIHRARRPHILCRKITKGTRRCACHIKLGKGAVSIPIYLRLERSVPEGRLWITSALPTVHTESASSSAIHCELRLGGVIPLLERQSPAVRRLAHLLHRDFIIEVVRIEWIHSALGRFRLWIHEIHQRLFGRTWQCYVVSVVICHPVHLP